MVSIITHCSVVFVRKCNGQHTSHVLTRNVIIVEGYNYITLINTLSTYFDKAIVGSLGQSRIRQSWLTINRRSIGFFNLRFHISINPTSNAIDVTATGISGTKPKMEVSYLHPLLIIVHENFWGGGGVCALEKPVYQRRRAAVIKRAN